MDENPMLYQLVSTAFCSLTESKMSRRLKGQYCRQ
jgi:hypothetical protein